MTISIALLFPEETERRVFTEKHLSRLAESGHILPRVPSKELTPELAKEWIAGADIAVTSWGCPKLDGDILDAAPGLKAVIHAAGSVKPIVSPELWSRGIRVSSANGPLGVGVAETALGLTIASLKGMWELTASAKTGNWYEGLDKVRELYDVTVGVIGAGKAGSHYIRLMKNFDVRILVSDPTITPEQADSWGVTLVGLDDLMRHSDVVSIHAPLLPETRKMINRERLGLMKDRAILINTARGALIDEEALANELRTGRISACLDVTDPEPPAPDHPFLHLPNCILTPHIAGAVNNGAKRMAAFAIEELKRFTAGQKMEGEVDPSSLNSLA